MSTGRMFLGPYQYLNTALKYFWCLSRVQCNNIFRGILTMTKTFLRPLEIQDVLVLAFWVVPVPIWIFACSTILSECICCDVHITMATDTLKCISFHVDVHPTSHWTSRLPHTAAHKKQESPSQLPIQTTTYWNYSSHRRADYKEYSTQQNQKVSGLQYSVKQASKPHGKYRTLSVTG